MRLLENLGLEPSIILLTHSHKDHVNMVDPLVKQFNAKVYMSAIEIDFYSFSCENLYPLLDGQSILLGGTNITCMLTPGHTLGSVCYLLSDSFFTGDTVFIEGCGICDTLGGSAEMMYETFEKIRRMIPLDVKVYPGHSFGQIPGCSLRHLLQYNIYFQIQTKEQFVLFRMRKNQKGLFDFK
ncbi:putative polyketide biosynthesis zinc-dependent hydrolase PksB [compost metagenome]